jgi:RimJ/RimL family protein N-acetyltransferase
MVHLVSMTESEFLRFEEYAIKDYAEQQAKADNWHCDEAMKKSEERFQRQFQDGLSTQGHVFYSVQDDELSAIVGASHIIIYNEGSKSKVFLDYLLIYEPFRGKGYGKQTLRMLHAKMIEMGINHIHLHVFSHNHIARALYGGMGYLTTGFQMLKQLDDEQIGLNTN